MIARNPLVIVPGGLNVDLIGLGVEKIIGPGELTLGGKLRIGPGGKARNMAQMAASYLGPGRVAMIGRTSQDPYGLWKIPVQSLTDAGVNTKYIKIMSFQEAGEKFPGVALIPVDRQGKNQIYVLPGVNQDFCNQDVDEAQALFEGSGQKTLIVAMEIPVETVAHCLEKAKINGLRVILDPGGISGPIDEILDEKIFLIKPNAHEAEILTGVSVADLATAKVSAQRLFSQGVQNVLLTLGIEGAFLFSRDFSEHIPCPLVKDTGIHDETGCGDQVTAIVASCLAEGKSLREACRLGILAGSLQFFRAGIQPVSKEDLSKDGQKEKRDETQ
jgi:ribokinase